VSFKVILNVCYLRNDCSHISQIVQNSTILPMFLKISYCRLSKICVVWHKLICLCWPMADLVFQFGAVFFCWLRCRICATVLCLTNEPHPLYKNRSSLQRTNQVQKWFYQQSTAACCLVMTQRIQDSSAPYLCTSKHHADQPVEVSALV